MTIEEIMKGERENIEYKIDIPTKSENYMRTVVAYANANGGRLVFGVENNSWKVVGFDKEEVFQKMDAITNAIYDSCEPKIAPNVEIQEFDGKYIIVVDIPAGMQRPYCIKSQGVIDGVYIRVSGTTRNIFITRKEFSGCIDEEIESAFTFVLEHINLGARIDGLVRQDIYELPIRTIREMLTNAVCHRSYLCPGKVQVALFDDRLEVTSPGMLDKDLTIEKMKAGISKIRNGAIAKVFSYMNMIEAWGTGIPKMFEETKAYGLQEPELQDMGSDFRINLYRKELTTDFYGVIDPLGTNGTKDGTNGTNDTGAVKKWEYEEKLIALIQENDKITQKQMSKKTGLSIRTIKRMTVELQKSGKILRVGNSRSGKWEVKDFT